MFVSLSVQCVPPSVSVCGSQMFVSLSVQCVPPPKNLTSSSLQNWFDLAHSTCYKTFIKKIKIHLWLYLERWQFYWYFLLDFYIYSGNFFLPSFPVDTLDFEQTFVLNDLNQNLTIYPLQMIFISNCSFIIWFY